MKVMMLSLAENSIQLVPDATLILHVLLVVLMVAILNKTLFTPINRVLAKREQKSKGRLEEARRLLATIEGHLARYEGALRAARAEGYRVLELQRREETQQREVRLSNTRDEIARMLAVEKKSIERQGEEGRRALEVDAQKLGLEISTRVLGRPIEPKPNSGVLNVDA